jgi:hypothetical protein
MHATAEERTLLEDWQARRKRLAKDSLPVEQFAETQLRVLDFLISQYGDSAEATRPARGIPAPELYVNNRAIIVLHHVWEKQVAGVKTTKEAQMRMASVLARMASRDQDEYDWTVMPSAAGDPETPAGKPVAAATLCSKAQPVDRKLWHRVLRRIAAEKDADRLIAITLREDANAPHEVVRHLYERLADPDRAYPHVAAMLVACDCLSAHCYVYRAWQESVEQQYQDHITEILDEFCTSATVRQQTAGKCRAALADYDADARMLAIDVLGRIGTLEDIGLLSDLLVLPPTENEHPNERAALTEAMERIAKAD